MTNSKHPLVRMAGICAILAPLVLLIGDCLLLTGRFHFEFTIALWLAFLFFVPAIIGITHLLYRSGSRLALVGGIFAYFGAMAGASMQVMFRVWAVLGEADAEPTIQLLRRSRKLFFSTQAIGLFFPLGLLILAVSLFRSRLVNPAIALALAVAAILFPMGRITGLRVGLIGGDILLIVVFGLIGIRLLSNGNGSEVFVD